MKRTECRICVNSTINPSITIGRNGLCQICSAYKKYFRKSQLKKERLFFNSFLGKGQGDYDIMAGISGGKDSSAMLYMLKKRGFRVLAFTFDTGYYPKHIFSKAAHVAKILGVNHIRIDIRKYIRPVDRKSFRMTADLYEEPTSEKVKKKFRSLYVKGREHYSAKCTHALPFVRTCQLCRRVVIRAYYAEAAKQKIPLVVLGINEWAHLSRHGKATTFSAVRKLQPYRNKPPVFVVHSPFLFHRKTLITKDILKRFGWRPPKEEKLIESNANSCLFAKAAETKAYKMLGFHPDATRLSREITAGFITKSQAKHALSKAHISRLSVRQILKKAKIL